MINLLIEWKLLQFWILNWFLGKFTKWIITIQRKLDFKNNFFPLTKHPFISTFMVPTRFHKYEDLKVVILHIISSCYFQEALDIAAFLLYCHILQNLLLANSWLFYIPWRVIKSYLGVTDTIDKSFFTFLVILFSSYHKSD